MLKTCKILEGFYKKDICKRGRKNFLTEVPKFHVGRKVCLYNDYIRHSSIISEIIVSNIYIFGSTSHLTFK